MKLKEPLDNLTQIKYGTKLDAPFSRPYIGSSDEVTYLTADDNMRHEEASSWYKQRDAGIEWMIQEKEGKSSVDVTRGRHMRHILLTYE